MPKPSLPQGTRDFPAEVVRKREFIFSTIKGVFEVYGFEPLETPAMENLETLTGKYGEEGDKLIFKILNNGLAHEKNIERARAGFEKILAGKNSADITERALRYDLTIPFARYVAMNHNKLTLPLRRYQVQPVWRADRPQKGRYREFTQCDADMVGSTTLFNEAELAGVYHEVFMKLGLTGYELRINHRSILAALADQCGGPEKMKDITIAIDKLDKTGPDKVLEDLARRGLDETEIRMVGSYLRISGSNSEKLAQAKTLLGGSHNLQKGIEDLEFVLNLSKHIHLIVDFTLARGLDYYTGMIFEAKAPKEVTLGSIGGGGRYDDLTGLFGVPGIPGVGISFGVDRIYDVMEELKLFGEKLPAITKALFFNMGENESAFAFGVMQQLRGKGIACELYPDETKIAKQFNHAEKKNIPFALIIGSNEMKQNTCQVKNLSTGLQETVALELLPGYFNKA